MGILLGFSGGVVVAGLAFGSEFVFQRPTAGNPGFGLFYAFGAWDGVWYRRITAYGYEYNPSKTSSIAFFPMLPALAGTIRRVTGLDALSSLLIVNTTAHCGAGLALNYYLRRRGCDRTVAVQILLCFLLWPMGLFMRVAYTESLFVLWVLLTFCGFVQRWPLIVVALLAGAATATRSVGVVLLLPLATWGLIAFLVYQSVVFGDAFAFARTQAHWSLRPDGPLWPRVLALVTLEPIWCLYVVNPEVQRHILDKTDTPLFSLNLWNSVYFVVCVGSVVYGAIRKLLTRHEVLLSAGLLLVPYTLQAYRMMMLGHGRFTCVVFPMAIVFGTLLGQREPVVGSIVYVLMGVQLFYWSALFAGGYHVY